MVVELRSNGIVCRIEPDEENFHTDKFKALNARPTFGLVERLENDVKNERNSLCSH